MIFDPPLAEAILIRRYKRFLADVTLPDGSTLTVHTPNTGAMLGCAEPGSRVWLRAVDNPRRKYPHSWDLVETRPGVMVGINTHLANELVAEALQEERIPELCGYRQVRREVTYGEESSRVDFLLTGHASQPDCYVEVKNVTAAVEAGIALFPDAVSTRGSRHLRELAVMKAGGYRSVLLFCVQREDVREVRPADAIDPLYGQTLRKVAAAGVEVLAYGARVSRREVVLDGSLAVSF